jgi:hypothetical protein
MDGLPSRRQHSPNIGGRAVHQPSLRRHRSFLSVPERRLDGIEVVATVPRTHGVDRAVPVVRPQAVDR